MILYSLPGYFANLFCKLSSVELGWHIRLSNAGGTDPCFIPNSTLTGTESLVFVVSY